MIECDANAKLGPEIIRCDPNKVSENGRLFFDILTRQNMTLGNKSSLCKGVITRNRNTLLKEERSVLDYFVFWEKLSQFFEHLMIDEGRTVHMY